MLFVSLDPRRVLLFVFKL